jgi:hypothetical protein
MPCWTIFRTGQYWWPVFADNPTLSLGSRLVQVANYDPGSLDWSHITVKYNKTACASLRGSASSLAQLENELSFVGTSTYNATFQNGACTNFVDVQCDYESGDIPCRISVRMQAALTLSLALFLKATYMVIWNFRRRGRHKTKCLTFGDVIAASALNSDMQVSNECLVNASEAYRKHVEHTCHKHCTLKVPSSSGDEIGHCQKCKKFNKTNLAAGLDHPIVATKYKKSLISNLGFTAVTQMIILMFCSFAMLGVSLLIAILSGGAENYYKKDCSDQAWGTQHTFFNKSSYDICMGGAKTYWESISGGWGGFNESVSLAQLPPNSLVSETSAFAIANGAQLIYSILYLLVIYNITLISMEHDWGTFEKTRQKLRCTIYKGRGFEQSYLLQLPKRVLFPLMGLSSLMHWLLGQAISTKEWVWHNAGNHTLGIPVLEVSQYEVITLSCPKLAL